MQIKKSMIAAGAAAVIGAGSLVGVASAQSDQQAGLVDKIAQRFNVDKNEVQKLFDEDRQARQAEREQRYEERLSQAVKDGKLTEEQKAKLLAKHKELKQQMGQKRESMRAERDSMDDKTEAEREQLREQRQAERKQLKSEIEAWGKANGIPSGYLMMGGPGGHGGPGGPKGGRS